MSEVWADVDPVSLFMACTGLAFLSYGWAVILVDGTTAMNFILVAFVCFLLMGLKEMSNINMLGGQ